MPNLSITLQAQLNVTDTTLTPSPQIITRSLNNPTLAATVSFYDPFFQASTATVVPLPAAVVYIAYVKNLDAAATLTVIHTPTGGASQSEVLVPGGVFLIFNPSEGAGGITALSLTSSAGPTSAEVMVAK